MIQKSIKQRMCSGFTLIELVITMVLISILFSVVALFIVTPVRSYTDTLRRLDLVDSAELSLRRIRRDIHSAIPNSIRVKTSDGKQYIEMVNTVEGVRYRAQGSVGSALDFNSIDTDFDIWGNFLFADLSNTRYRLIIYNTGAVNAGNFDSPIAGVNVYSTVTAPIGSVVPPAGTSVITPAGRTITLSNPSNLLGHVNISGGGWQFAFASPQQRLFISDGPVTYVCDPVAGTIFRYSGYTITNIQPTSFANDVQKAQLTNQVSACTFNYQQGAYNRNALVLMQITLTNRGESVTLMHQVGVTNIP